MLHCYPNTEEPLLFSTLLLMEKPTFKEKKSYTTQVMDGKSKVKADTDFEIDILESKAILQTISDDPVQLAIK